MCGFAGVINYKHPVTEDDLAETLTRMADSIYHRGPDDSGVWLDLDAGIGLAHRRLSILDLSAAGHQPMLSSSGRFCIAYNGEVYNFQEIRKALDSKGSRNWRGHSDTEVVLAAIEEWGAVKTLRAMVGMFSFALWDRQEKTLLLARDRMGEKPLYYGENNGVFLFGSDLKSFLQTKCWEPEIDHDAVGLFIKYGYIPAPLSIYKGMRKLIPGSYLIVTPGDIQSGKLNEKAPEQYWSFPDPADKGTSFSGDTHSAVEELETLLRQSVSLQQIADVPLGTFLSGGIDSSLITALLQAGSSHPVKTFSIGFKEASYNEAAYAKAVAEHLGTDHTERYLTPAEIISVIPELPKIYSEPFADVSQLPTTIVARLARERVTVSLSGDGGDELFCGYERYQKDTVRWAQLNRVPGIGRKILAYVIDTIPHPALDYLLAWGRFIRTSDMHQGRLSSSVKRLGDELTFTRFDQLYDYRMSHVRHPENIVPSFNILALRDKYRATPDLFNYMMTRDTLTYLPDDILTKVDRAAMSISLETRIPMLDHRVVEFAADLPVSIKCHDGQLKWPLRQILYKYVPNELIDRPKMGFGVPMGRWLRGPLREWAGDLLSERALKEQAYLSPQPIIKLWNEHQKGQFNHQASLWDILMFQAWRRENNL